MTGHRLYQSGTVIRAGWRLFLPLRASSLAELSCPSIHCSVEGGCSTSPRLPWGTFVLGLGVFHTQRTYSPPGTQFVRSRGSHPESQLACSRPQQLVSLWGRGSHPESQLACSRPEQLVPSRVQGSYPGSHIARSCGRGW